MKNRRSKTYWFLLIPLFTLIVGCGPDDDPPEGTWEFTIPENFGSIPDSPEDNPITENGVALGRQLFYEKQLSSDGTFSCGTCHQQEHGFGDGKTLSTGVAGEELSRHTPALSNLLWHDNFFWDGRASSLEEQARGPIEDSLEMNLSMGEAVSRLQGMEKYPPLFELAFGSDSITSDGILRAIAQFERTLISGNSKYDRFKRGEVDFTAQELRGEKLFFTHPEPDSIRGGNCGDCHSGIFQLDNGFHNIGLDTTGEGDAGLLGVTSSPFDFGKFKTPSLRNIAMTAPYMHDGRFNSLEEVMMHYQEHIINNGNLDVQLFATNASPLDPNNIELKLTEQEIEDIIAFLHTLTDEDYLTNPEFSDPSN